MVMNYLVSSGSVRFCVCKSGVNFPAMSGELMWPLKVGVDMLDVY